MNKQRITAVIGLVLIILSVLCVISVGFLPQLKDLLMTISTVTFLAAATILGVLSWKLKAQQEEQSDDTKEE